VDDIDTQRAAATPRHRSASNRRSFFRLATALPIRVWTSSARGTELWPVELTEGARVLETTTEDISIGGLKFRAPAALESGTLVDVFVPLEGCERHVKARVAHARTDRFGAAIGIEFVMVNGDLATRLARTIAVGQRSRLPTVSVSYAVRCETESAALVYGSTEECSPSDVTVLLHSPIRPGEAVSLEVTVDRADMILTGVVVSCVQADDLWRTAIELHGMPDLVAKRWRDIVVERRAGMR
jgi:hypothetical protein